MKKTFLTCFFSFLLISCGNDNIFTPLADTGKTDQDKAYTAIQNKDYSLAITYLTSYLASNPNDTTSKVLLTTACLKKVGVNELTLASEITKTIETQDISSALAILEIFPEGTSSNVTDLTLAVNTLSSIPLASRTDEQNLQLAIASSALIVTVLKQNEIYENEEVSINNISNISAEEAQLILSTATTAAESLSTLGTLGSASEPLLEVVNSIHNAEGTTDSEKLQNFLASL